MHSSYLDYFKTKHCANLTMMFDIDGTLLYKQQTVDRKNLVLIEDLKKYQCNISLATGRSYIHTKEIINQVKPTIPIICFDGALIFDPCDNKILFNTLLNSEIVEKIDCIFHENFHIFCEGFDTVYAKDRYQQLIFSKSFNIESKNIAISDFYRKHNFANRMYLRKLENANSKDFSLIVKFCKEYNLIFEEISSEWISIGPNINKLDAFRILEEKQILDRDHTFYFGDGENDIRLLKYLEYSFSMGNASNKVKSCAKYCTDSVYGLGVSKVLANIINNFREWENIM